MRILFLVGLPGSGKSTFRQEMISRLSENELFDDVLGSYTDQYAFISSDDIVEAVAKERGQTYNEIFQDKKEEGLIDWCMQRTDQFFINAVTLGQYIVVDRTNMSIKSRAKYLAIAKAAGYQADAVVFARPMTDAAHNDWNKRLDRPGKTIPNNVLQQMFQDYQRPTIEEGFANVVDIDSFGNTAS